MTSISDMAKALQTRFTFEWIYENGSNIRVHGNGFIQIDLDDTRRIHVWGHPAIPRQRVSTQIHDHRFVMESSIVSGRLVNTTYVLDKRNPTHEVYLPVPGDGEETTLEGTGEMVRPMAYEVSSLPAGTSYTMSEGLLHETHVNEPTVTFMKKRSGAKVVTPRVLCSIGQKPDNEFVRGRVMTAPQLWEIVNDVIRY